MINVATRTDFERFHKPHQLASNSGDGAYQPMPLQLSWKEALDVHITVEATVLRPSRHGAIILVDSEIAHKQEVSIYNPTAGKACQAVVRQRLLEDDRGYTVRVEFIDRDFNLWNLPASAFSETD